MLVVLDSQLECEKKKKENASENCVSRGGLSANLLQRALGHSDLSPMKCGKLIQRASTSGPFPTSNSTDVWDRRSQHPFLQILDFGSFSERKNDIEVTRNPGKRK